MSTLTAPAAVVLDRDAARAKTDRLRLDIAAAHELLLDLWRGRAWVALDYPSWPAYLDAEFGDTLHIRLPQEQRREIAGALRAEGMSLRAIAVLPGINVSPAQVHADLRDVDAPARVTGLDGRSRAAKTAAPSPTPAPKVTRAQQVVDAVARRGEQGLTIVELSRALKVRDGVSSGALSRLERQGRVRRDGRFRGGYGVYVVAES